MIQQHKCNGYTYVIGGNSMGVVTRLSDQTGNGKTRWLRPSRECILASWENNRISTAIVCLWCPTIQCDCGNTERPNRNLKIQADGFQTGKEYQFRHELATRFSWLYLCFWCQSNQQDWRHCLFQLPYLAAITISNYVLLHFQQHTKHIIYHYSPWTSEYVINIMTNPDSMPLTNDAKTDHSAMTHETRKTICCWCSLM